MRLSKLQSQTGYRKRRPKHKAGKPSRIAPNRLDQQFNVERPNAAWVTDITYIRTYEGWLFLAVVLDLFSRQVPGKGNDGVARPARHGNLPRELSDVRCRQVR